RVIGRSRLGISDGETGAGCSSSGEARGSLRLEASGIRAIADENVRCPVARPAQTAPSSSIKPPTRAAWGRDFLRENRERGISRPSRAGAGRSDQSSDEDGGDVEERPLSQ